MVRSSGCSTSRTNRTESGRSSRRCAAADSGSEQNMTIKAGDRMPEGQFMVMGENGPQPLPTNELFSGKKVVLFSVPGAFTPTCSAKHLPGFVENADQLKAKGVDTIACMAVNDVFVMS